MIANPANPNSLANIDDDGISSAFPRSVEDAERDAERIASGARAAAGLILAAGLLAALAFVPDDERQYLLPRLALALGIMVGLVVLAVISFLASRSTRYRPGLAYLFVIGDAVLVFVGLEGGLRLSGHAGPLVFANPGIWLIPIALAIQSVRFRTGPLVFAAILYLAELVGIVLFGGTGRELDDTASNLIALFAVPPDAIRVLMLMVAATALVVSVRSKRDILLKGLRTARREAELQRFLPAEVSRKLGSVASGDAHASQRELAILFLDLIGFTRASEQVEPIEIAGWLAEFRERMNGLVQTNGGFVDKFIGDGVMAIFGYEGDPDTAARQAFRVVEALPAAMADWQASDPSAPKFQIAAGGALGQVFVGVIGAGDRREFTVVGDAVNIASRLEAHAKDHNGLAALNFELVARAGHGPRFDAAAEDVAIRGHSEPVRTCLITWEQVFSD